MAIDTLWSSVLLLCPFIDDLLDVKGHNVTPVGGAALSSAAGNPFGAGNALLFGSGKYLTLSDSADWAFGTGDFLVETWVYPTSFPGGGVGNDMCLLNIPGSPQFFFYIDNATGCPILWNGTTGVTGSSALTLNAWNCVSVKRVSSTLEIWLGSSSIASLGSYTTNFAAYTGATVGGLVGSRYLFGYMSQMRITKAGRTITLPSAPFPRPTIRGHVYDANAAPVAKTILVRDRSTGIYLGGANSDPTTGAYLFYPPDFGEMQVARIDELCDPMTDECVFDLDPAVAVVGGRLNNDTKLHALQNYGDVKLNVDGISFEFDGSGDCIQSTSSDYSLGLHDFDISIEFYLISGGHGSVNPRILQIGPNNTSGTIEIQVTGSDNPATISAWFYDTSWHVVGSSGAETYSNNAWNKLRLRRVNGVFYLEINGTLVSTSAALFYNITATQISIGANTANGDNFYGRIGRVRISKGPRRAAASISNALLLSGPADGGSGENALIYDRVVPGG